MQTPSIINRVATVGRPANAAETRTAMAETFSLGHVTPAVDTAVWVSCGQNMNIVFHIQRTLL